MSDSNKKIQKKDLLLTAGTIILIIKIKITKFEGGEPSRDQLFHRIYLP